MNLGTAIKNIRQLKKIRQNTLAKMTGISQTYLSQIENNVKEPNISVLRLISEKIEIPLPVLFFLSLDSDDIKPEKRQAYSHLETSIKSMLSEFFVNKNS